MFLTLVFLRVQTLCFDFHGVNLVVAVTGMQALDLSNLKGSLGGAKAGESPMKSVTRGVLMQQTQIQFTKAQDSTIKLKGAAKGGPTTAIIQPDFKFEDLGIGGLDKEFSAIFRRAFASRIFPPALVEKLGIQHVKGILLYGPPGTGKTLMARQIGKMLNAREPLIVNGPEVLNKYVGQSEENIRKLFAPAEAEVRLLFVILECSNALTVEILCPSTRLRARILPSILSFLTNWMRFAVSVVRSRAERALGTRS